MAVILKFYRTSESPRRVDPTPRISDSVRRSGVGPGICISNKVFSDADAAGLGTLV